MARDQHGFCALHRIGYRIDLDPTCPQCTMAGLAGQTQMAYDSEKQVPISEDGTELDRRTLKPLVAPKA